MRQVSGTDYHELDDPEFLAERARVRELLQRTPEGADNYAELADVLKGMDDEFLRRAHGAWSKVTERGPARPSAISPRIQLTSDRSPLMLAEA